MGEARIDDLKRKMESGESVFWDGKPYKITALIMRHNRDNYSNQKNNGFFTQVELFRKGGVVIVAPDDIRFSLKEEETD